jgi:hypothetical protein
MSTHSVPLHCPYCGGERLFPHGDSHGAWECRDCLRAFSVTFVGLLAPASAGRLDTETSSLASSPSPTTTTTSHDPTATTSGGRP